MVAVAKKLKPRNGSEQYKAPRSRLWFSGALFGVIAVTILICGYVRFQNEKHAQELLMSTLRGYAPILKRIDRLNSIAAAAKSKLNQLRNIKQPSTTPNSKLSNKNVMKEVVTTLVGKKNKLLFIKSGSVAIENGKNLKKRLPSAIIIGARKCGTGALQNFLALHPNIAMRSDEGHFFSREKHYSKGLDFYRDMMPESTENQITMEKTPEYFHHPEVPERIRNFSRNIKFILILRDPVIRVVSDYTREMYFKFGWKRKMYKPLEKLLMKDKSLDTENEWVDIGFYQKHYKRWLAYFSGKQFLILEGQKLITNPLGTLWNYLEEIRKVEKFLGLVQYINETMVVFSKSKGYFCPARGGRLECLNEFKGRPQAYVSDTVLDQLRDYYESKNEDFCDITNATFTWCSYYGMAHRWENYTITYVNN